MSNDKIGASETRIFHGNRVFPIDRRSLIIYHLSMYSDNKNKDLAKELTAIDPNIVNELRATVTSDKVILLVAETFHVLGDPTRLKILYLLKLHSCCVRDLAILTSVSESAISHHMRLLKERRLVTQRREGTTIYYSLSDHHLGPLFQEAEYHADHVYRELPDHPYP